MLTENKDKQRFIKLVSKSLKYGLIFPDFLVLPSHDFRLEFIIAKASKFLVRIPERVTNV